MRGFLQVYRQVEGVQRHPRGFAVRLRVREAVQGGGAVRGASHS